MNKLEIRTLIANGLLRHVGDGYGYLNSVEAAPVSPADPEPHLLVSAVDPLGDMRRFRITIEEIEDPS